MKIVTREPDGKLSVGSVSFTEGQSAHTGSRELPKTNAGNQLTPILDEDDDGTWITNLEDSGHSSPVEGKRDVKSNG
ncbi:MAG: hypothetical protein M1834_007628 [Cirrosporium novae-zelandiae]|nr:MAG: hypothetical protein M1834_007628 [Cirrosporium novae-zelandiae]